ncbi:High mobility group box domain [Macleaya cordata]|uniref:High mobility group box domain n=1 Tax=Macleaya cordata TaxID=56857 RepID=A0A200R173_MACCD|nr:High mobility group box domain [Macleaya cordata]
MGKKAPKSKKSLSASASVNGTSRIAEKKKLLRPKSPEKMKMTTRQTTRASEKQKKPISPKKFKANPKKKIKKDGSNTPKKPPTAFFFFLEDFRKAYQEQNPDVKSMRDIGKACGEKWKIMSYEEKVQYYDIATEKRAEFEEVMAEYKKKQESGEDQESDDYSEFNE